MSTEEESIKCNLKIAWKITLLMYRTSLFWWLLMTVKKLRPSRPQNLICSKDTRCLYTTRIHKFFIFHRNEMRGDWNIRDVSEWRRPWSVPYTHIETRFMTTGGYTRSSKKEEKKKKKKKVKDGCGCIQLTRIPYTDIYWYKMNRINARRLASSRGHPFVRDGKVLSFSSFFPFYIHV